MKKILLVLALLLTVTALLPAVVLAAKPVQTGAGKPDTGGGGETSSTMTGYDISWPQCGSKLPTPGAFAIIGVTGGTAADTNECLATQLAWGNRSTGKVLAQPHLQLYVNTANPGVVRDQINTWPKTNLDVNGNPVNNRYGNTCTGENDLSCSWLYGWNRAVESAEDRFLPAAKIAGVNEDASSYIWWLDVETMNTWQSGSDDALKKNVAALEGMAYYYNSIGATVGLYSTAYQWNKITGNFINPTSSLYGLANWRPSGSSLNNAIANCGLEPFSAGGFMSLTQYIHKRLDHNYSCL